MSKSPGQCVISTKSRVPKGLQCYQCQCCQCVILHSIVQPSLILLSHTKYDMLSKKILYSQEDFECRKRLRDFTSVPQREMLKVKKMKKDKKSERYTNKIISSVPLYMVGYCTFLKSWLRHTLWLV